MRSEVVAESPKSQPADLLIRGDRRESGSTRWTVVAGLVALTAFWGVVVDADVIPLLAPTGNSTLFQASTAASFSILGILFGPWIGALAGICRDTFIYVEQVIAHPSASLQAGVPHYVVKWLVDAIEDAMLGFIPGLVALRIRRLGALTIVSAISAWISLPFLVIGYTLNDGHPSQVWHAITTTPGDWNEPVDPNLTVYALLVAAMVALVVARWTTRPRASLAIGAAFAAAALALILFGGHP